MMRNKFNVVKLPVLSAEDQSLEELEVELVAAAARVAVAQRKRDELIDRISEPIRQREIERLRARGITLGKTRVIVSSFFYDKWTYKEAIVMDVKVEPAWWDDVEEPLRISYECAPVKKDGTPSKASLGMCNPEIERLA